MILVNSSLVLMKWLSRKLLGGGRYVGVLRFSETVEARSYGCGA